MQQSELPSQGKGLIFDVAMRLTICLIALCVVCFSVNAQEPRFTDYPAKVVKPKSLVKIQSRSSADTHCFRTMLRQTAKEGTRFAGHYAINYWGCGTSCARIGIVDLLTGRTYVSPFYVGIAGGGPEVKPIKTEPNSRLVLVNDPEMVRKEYGEPPPEEFAPTYFLWTGRNLLPIRQGKVDRAEPARAFERCAEANRL